MLRPKQKARSGEMGTEAQGKVVSIVPVTGANQTVIAY
jgi:hypothetical protein